jgi:hypothetical protein
MILFFNAQSIIRKIDTLCFIASEKQADIILVTEYWCNQEVIDAFLALPDYEIQSDLRKDRKDAIRGIRGGLLVYAKSGVTILPIKHDAVL